MLKTSTQKYSSTHYYLWSLALGILLATQTSCTNNSQLNFENTEPGNPSQRSNLSQNYRESRGKGLLSYLLKITSASQLNEELIEDLLANERLTAKEKVKAFEAMVRKLKKDKPVKQLVQVLSRPAECNQAAVGVILTSKLTNAAQVKALKWISTQLPHNDKQMAQILDGFIHSTLHESDFSINHEEEDALKRRAYAVRKQFRAQSSRLTKKDLLQLVFSNPQHAPALLQEDHLLSETEKYLVNYVIDTQFLFREVTESSPWLLFKKIESGRTPNYYERELELKSLKKERIKGTQRDHFIHYLARKKYGYPLHVAIVYGIPVEALRGLFDRGADATHSDKKYGYPLHAAIVHKRSVEVLQELVNQGADVTHSDPKRQGNSPLATALKHQNTAAVEFLLPYLSKRSVEERAKAYQLLLPYIKDGQAWSGRAYTDWLLGEYFEESFIRKQLQISETEVKRMQLIEEECIKKHQEALKKKKLQNEQDKDWEVELEQGLEQGKDPSLGEYFAKKRQEDPNHSYEAEYETELVFSDASSTEKQDNDSDAGSEFDPFVLSDEEGDQED